MEYPPHLHDTHNYYPLAPEHLKITCEITITYSQALGEALHYRHRKVEKLVPNLHNKEKYIVHHRNLKLYLDLGMKLSKIHGVLQFKQEPWFKQYIDLNTQMRAEAKNGFEKDFFKLTNNSVFGKTIQNIRKHVKVELVTESQKMKKLVAKPTFKVAKQFNEHLVGVNMGREKLLLNKPVYTGFTLLDLFKVLMYQFHY